MCSVCTLWQATYKGVYQSEGVFTFFPSPFSRYSELFVHGLGAAIHRAINLALQLKETSSHTLEVRRYNTIFNFVREYAPRFS